MSYIIIIFLLFLVIFFAVLWIRARNKNSKGRFALAVVSAMLGIAIMAISMAATSLPSVVILAVLQKLGIAQPPIFPTEILTSAVVLFFAVFMIRILEKFGSNALKTWDGTLRVSDLRLVDSDVEQTLIQYALNEVEVLRRRVQDPIADPKVSKWRDDILEPPTPKDEKNYIRDVFLTRFPEATIPITGWRSKEHFWAGTILCPYTNDELPLVVLIAEKSENFRFKKLILDCFPDKAKIYAIINSSEDFIEEVTKIEGRDVLLYSTRRLLIGALDLRTYAKKLIELYNREQIVGTGVSISDSYVPIRANEGKRSDINIENELRKWELEKGGRHFAIVGDYGQGKSTVSLKFCADWAKEFLSGTNLERRVPFLIELRGHNPYESTPVAFLGSWAAHLGLDPKVIYLLIQCGGATVFFEGFDELKSAGLEYNRYQHFKALWKFAYPKSKIVFTGRPNFFLDDKECNRSLRGGNKEKIGGMPYTAVYRLLPLDHSQIKEACRSYEPLVAEGIYKLSLKDSSFYDVISRPSMLPVVATIWNEIENSIEKGGSLSSAEVIDMYISASLIRKEAELERDRIEKDASESTRYLVFSLLVRRYLTEIVSWHMIRNKLQNSIKRSDVQDLFFEIYNELGNLAKQKGVDPVLSRGLLEFDRQHPLLSIREKAEIITTEVCSSGLLINDPTSGEGYLQFAHKQFFEFMVAKVAVDYIRDMNNPIIKLTVRNQSVSNVLGTLSLNPVSCKFVCQLGDKYLQKLMGPVDKIALSIPYYLLGTHLGGKILGAKWLVNSGISSVWLPLRPILPFSPRKVMAIVFVVTLLLLAGAVYLIKNSFIDIDFPFASAIASTHSYTSTKLILSFFYFPIFIMTVTLLVFDVKATPASRVLMWKGRGLRKSLHAQLMVCAFLLKKETYRFNGVAHNTRSEMENLWRLFEMGPEEIISGDSIRPQGGINILSAKD